jgi:PadR family transcriptional regulator AphA
MKRYQEEPLEPTEAYPITYGVLGLLAFLGPMSGYDIKRAFDHALAPMWGAAHSQIYKELRRMEPLGWVQMKREEQESRPDRKVYSVTPEGQQALIAWEGQPSFVLQMRDELLLKILFGSYAPPDALKATVKAGIEFYEQRMAVFQDNLNHLIIRHDQPQEAPEAGQSNGDPYARLITQLAIAGTETYLKWLHEVLAFVENRQKEEGG